ncbi:GtrA family protein [Armatimonas sp.]|uniref:GtrA family protein n=1 Tax=Armatimonas sp. TaxID=1872638 RepID=UPI00374FEAED
MIIHALKARPSLTQFVKFCIVGLSSTLIDFAIYNLCLNAGLLTPIALTFSFMVGLANGFYWNRRWTFRAVGGDRRKQGSKFLASNSVGWLLNLTVTTLALVLAAHWHLTKTHHTPQETLNLVLFRAANDGQGFSRLALNAAKACATVVVTAWNFTAAKFFTFKD